MSLKLLPPILQQNCRFLYLGAGCLAVQLETERNAIKRNTVKHLDLTDNQFDWLAEKHGPLIGNAPLARALGFANTSAFRQARRRGLVDVTIFKIPGRRGVFALTEEVARWIAKQVRVSSDQEQVAANRKCKATSDDDA